MADLPQQFINEASEQFVESSHKFTEPIRLFKSNDPYYFEVDNIPLKQLEENVLFLRDQIANNLSVSGIGREDLAELRPFVTGSDRNVYVNPGRFTARINDCYQKGINILNEIQAVDNAPASTGLERSDIASKADRRKTTFNLPVDVLKKLAGEVLTGAILDNGLFHFLQHHNSEALSDNSLRFSFSQDLGVNSGTGIDSLPKNKLAIWRSFGQNFQEGFNLFNDLQQESVEFTRFWGGAIRTAIVNVPETLSISVPEFNESDYDNQTTFTPTTRVDLLFVFAHPMDSSSTTIAKPSGSLPTTITSPQLGLLTGAGVIALNEGNNSFANFEKGQDPSFFDGTTFSEGSGFPSNFFESSKAVNDTTLNFQMISTVGDQNQSEVGVGGRFTNLPSPDDLLNLTPLFEDTLVNNSLARVGQSILPLAYIITRRGSSAIETQDVFDIRPFFRTTELSYNERAGVAAANPPLSFANPAVGKKEFQKSLFDVRDTIMTEVNKPIFISKPIAGGIIYGGTEWGVEGALIENGVDLDEFSPGTDETTHAQYLEDNYHLPSERPQTGLPRYPGWDINTKYFDSNEGANRNDRLFSAVKFGSAAQFNKESTSTFVDMIQSTCDIPNGFGDGGDRFLSYHGMLFCKKTFTLSPETFTSDFTNFDVKADLVNCCLMTGQPGGDSGANSDVTIGSSQTGIFIEKNIKARQFTIYVALGPVAPHQGAYYFGKPTNLTEGVAGGRTQESYMREDPAFSRVMVMTNRQLQENPDLSRPNLAGGVNAGSFGAFVLGSAFRNRQSVRKFPTYFPYMVTYPTVSFTVFGLKGDASINQIFSTNATSNAPEVL